MIKNKKGSVSALTAAIILLLSVVVGGMIYIGFSNNAKGAVANNLKSEFMVDEEYSPYDITLESNIE